MQWNQYEQRWKLTSLVHQYVCKFSITAFWDQLIGNSGYFSNPYNTTFKIKNPLDIHSEGFHWILLEKNDIYITSILIYTLGKAERDKSYCPPAKTQL